MALQPNPPCKIRKGKAPGAFAGFVDTFNWMVDFCTNLCGEGEQTSQGGSTIRVDRSVSDHPVIRGGGSGGGGGISSVVAVNKKITLISGSDSNLKFTVADNSESTTIYIDAYYV